MDLLRREQVKYVFHPPRYSRLIAPLLTWLGTLTYLRRKFRVATISMEGAHRVRELTAQGHMVLVAPNHADHADPHVLAEVGRKDGLAFHYMAAREVFEIQGRIGRWALSRIGSFSVDREGADMVEAAEDCQVAIIHPGLPWDTSEPGIDELIARAAAFT